MDNPIIRVTVVRKEHTGWNGRVIPAQTITQEFTDEAIAVNWFIHDSYFEESYTTLAVWTRLDDKEAVEAGPACHKCGRTDGEIRYLPMGRYMHVYGACPPYGRS